MAEYENNISKDNDKDNADLLKINQLINRLDVCTSSLEENLNESEINTILNTMKDSLNNLKIRKRLASNKDIIQQKLTDLFNHFCQIIIKFSSLLHNYPLFLDVFITMWNLISTKLDESIEKEILSAKELYMTAINGLSIDQISIYFSGNEVENIFKSCAKIFVKLAQIVIWSDTRRTEYLNLTDYMSYKCIHKMKYDNIFHKIILFVDYCFTQIKTSTDQNDCIATIFSLIVTMSDSKGFLPTTIRIGLPAKLVEWLNIVTKKSITFNPLSSIIVSISNISQCEEGIIALNKADAITVLCTSEKLLAERLQKSPFILSFYPRIYAMLATTDQLKTLPVLEPAIDHLLMKIHEANAAKNLRSSTGHLYEYLVPLAKLVINDNMAKYLLNNVKFGGLAFFIELFHKHNLVSTNDLFVKHLIRLALYNILCSLSFHQTVQQELKENQIFIKAVMEASHSSTSNNEAFIPSSFRNDLMTVKAAADGILVYLDQFKAPTSDNNNVISKSTTKIPMISYSHKDANFCRSIVTALKEHSISVWIDEDGHCLSDDCWEEIAVAIKNASMVLIVVSDNYCTKSDSCRVEATYAIKLKIPIVALYIDDKYQAEPWLDIHLTGLHVKFGQKSFAERISRLAKYITARNNTSEVTETLRAEHPSHEVNLVPIEESKPAILTSKRPEDVIDYSVPKTSPHTWSAIEVRSWWCSEKKLVPQLCNFCDGEALCVYARLFTSSYQENPLKHFQILQARLKQQHNIDFYDDQYANIVSSMMWTVKQYGKSEQIVPNRQQSISCILL
ncbi:hypothetical protein I4U23_023376 [Adineta vaga]|nr:hypothetical protein I4U23_023376 [Adineta vaga]